MRSEEARAFEELIERNLAAGNHRLVLDFSRLDWVDSYFIGMLVGLQRRIEELRGALVLCNVEESVLRLFRVVRLDDYFAICSSISEAFRLAEKER